MIGRFTILPATATAIVAVAIGCGCGGSSTSGSATESSGASSAARAEFVKMAGAACEKQRVTTIERIGAFEKRHSSEGLPKAVLSEHATRAVLLSTIAAEIAVLRRLKAPAGDEEELAAILASQEAALAEAKKGRQRSPKEVTPANEISALFNDADRELRAYGLVQCGKG